MPYCSTSAEAQNWAYDPAKLKPIEGGSLMLRVEVSNAFVITNPELKVEIVPNKKFSINTKVPSEGNTICDSSNPAGCIYKYPDQIAMGATAFHYRVETDTIYGTMDLGASVIEDNNSLEGLLATGLSSPDNYHTPTWQDGKFRGSDGSQVEITMIPEHFECTSSRVCMTETNSKFRLQFGSDTANDVTTFGTRATIYSNWTESGRLDDDVGPPMCRASDFLEASSTPSPAPTANACYRDYYGGSATVEENFDGLRGDRYDVYGEAQGFIDKERGISIPRFIDADLDDAVIFKVSLSQAYVQFQSSVADIMTIVDVVSGLGGISIAISGIIVFLMNQIEMSIDPNGPLMAKVEKTQELTAKAQLRAAEVQGLDVSPDTPDVHFDGHTDGDIEIPEEDTHNLQKMVLSNTFKGGSSHTSQI